MPYNAMCHTTPFPRLAIATLLVIGSIGFAPNNVAAQMAANTSTIDAIPAYKREHMQADPAIYARYRRPGQCAAAAFRANDFYWRNKRRDTLVSDPLGAKLPDTVVAVARACGSRFDVEKVPLLELIGLTQLYFWSEQPALAARATDRLIAESASWPVVQRGWAFTNLIAAYRAAIPRRQDGIKMLLAKLDSLGQAAAEPAFFAHVWTSSGAYELNQLNDVASEGEAAIHAASQMSKNDRADRVGVIVNAYSELAEQARLTQGIQAATAVVERARGDALTTRAPGTQQYMLVQNWIDRIKSNYPFYGRKASTLESLHWFNTNGDSTPRPRTGKVTLVFFGDANCRTSCYGMYALLRRVHERYAQAGLEIVLSAKTNGYFRAQLMEKPAEEVEQIRKYFLDFLKLPVTLAVSETQFARSMDGRRFGEPGANQRQWPQYDLALIGKDGTFSYLTYGATALSREKLFMEQIEKAMK